MARLWVKRLLSTAYDTPMLLSAPPLEHIAQIGAPSKVEFTTYTGRFYDWLNARMAAPPVRAGGVTPVAEEPAVDHLQPPPRADGPRRRGRHPLALASTNVRFCNGELGVVLVLAGVRWSTPGRGRRCSCTGCGGATTAERPAATVDHDAWAGGVDDLGGSGQRWSPVGAAVEGDDTAPRHALHHRVARATGGVPLPMTVLGLDVSSAAA